MKFVEFLKIENDFDQDMHNIIITGMDIKLNKDTTQWLTRRALTFFIISSPALKHEGKLM